MKQYLKKSITLVLLALSSSLMAAEPLDVNTATAEQLALALKGIGQSKAEAIIQYRTEHGPFASLDDLTKVKGIGAALLDKNKAVIQVKTEIKQP